MYAYNTFESKFLKICILLQTLQTGVWGVPIYILNFSTGAYENIKKKKNEHICHMIPTTVYQ